MLGKTLFPFLCLNLWMMCAFSMLSAQEKTVPKPERVYQFDKKQLETLRQNPDFQYEDVDATPSLWQQFRQWLREFIFGTMDSEQKQNVWSWILTIFAGLVLVYVIVRLSGADVQQLFRSTKQTSSPNVLLMDDLTNWQAADFEQQITQAIRQNDFDLAVRWLYLKTLKTLDDKKHIRWQKDKTNQTYVRELSKTDFGKNFQGLTEWFEYVHYGDFELNEPDFNIIMDDFNAFFEQLGGVYSK